MVIYSVPVEQSLNLYDEVNIKKCLEQERQG